jgi:hypothetical protein
MGRRRRRNPAWRCRLVRTRRETLAWRQSDGRNDAHRHSGSAQRESC